MTKWTEERFAAKDGLNIFFRRWRPENDARGVLIIVPGFNSHSGYYQRVADRLCEQGLAFDDPLNDADREDVMTDIPQWIGAHLHV